MKICTASLKSIVPYSSSRMHDSAKLKDETHDAFDKRTWREKATYNEDGVICIPGMGLKMAVDEAAKRIGQKIEGKRGATYTKYFVAGQICEADVPIGVHKDDLECIEIWANADGVRGSGKRVRRVFPYVKQWAGVARFLLLDETIPRDVFEKTLIGAGRLIGVGRFRPEKGGMLGRFSVENMEWSEV